MYAEGIVSFTDTIIVSIKKAGTSTQYREQKQIHRFLSLLKCATCLKAREAFTEPFCFLCDYADQSDQHMYFIAMRLEILKDDIAVFHEKNQQVVFRWKKPELGQGENPTKMDDVV
jgi:hypothetical protein